MGEIQSLAPLIVTYALPESVTEMPPILSQHAVLSCHAAASRR